MKIYKLNFPNIKTGSIIYYTYTYSLELGKTMNSQYFPLLWKFQDIYPKLDSRFELIIPYEIDFRDVPKNISFKKINSQARI